MVRSLARVSNELNDRIRYLHSGPITRTRIKLILIAMPPITALIIANVALERLAPGVDRDPFYWAGKPMTPLINIRQETFCRLIATGKSATASYATAYGRAADVSSRVNGRRLLTNANIRTRIAQIRHSAAAAACLTLPKLIGEVEMATLVQIRTGSLRSACKAVEQFAKMILSLAENA